MLETNNSRKLFYTGSDKSPQSQGHYGTGTFCYDPATGEHHQVFSHTDNGSTHDTDACAGDQQIIVYVICCQIEGKQHFFTMVLQVQEEQEQDAASRTQPDP